MRQEARKWLARSAFVALVAIGTLIAGPRIAAARDCPYPSAGTCPPLDNASCYQACKDAGWTDGGQCHVGCCVCFA